MARNKKKAARPYRSKFEESIGANLERRGVPFTYETETFKILVPVRGVACKVCGAKEIMRQTRYTPDFFLPHWIVEAKGKFTANDRKRVLALLPVLGRRPFGMLFMRDNKLSKSSETRYTDWCAENGVACAVGTIPEGWTR